MELIPKLCTIIGLCFDIVGVIFLAYDLFWGPGNKWQLEILNTQLKNELWLHKSILSDYKKLSESIGDNRAARHINREINRHAVSNKKLEKSIEKLKSDYPNRVQIWSLKGLGLILFGFFLQAVGTAIN